MDTTTLRTTVQRIQADAAAALALIPSDVPVVTTADGLTAAFAAGGVYSVSPGTYPGNFVARKPIILTLDPNAKLVNQNNLDPTLQVQGDDIAITGGAVTGPSDPSRETLVVGDLAATTAAANPHRVVLRGMTVLADAKGGHRGIALHGSDLTVDQCSILGYYLTGQDCQGIWICNGPGPYTVTNNVIEASGENVLVGGADPKIPGCLPTTILIQRNTLHKQDAWRTLKNTSKNCIELKLGVHVQILDNVITNWWHDGQNAPVQFTVRNQDSSAPWSRIDDVTFSRNVIHGDPTGFAINILGSDDDQLSGQIDTITIDGNLFVNCSDGFQVLNGVRTKLAITNNTLPAITGRMFSFDFPSKNQPSKVLTPLTFSKNVLKTGQYGIAGDGTEANSLASLLAYCTVQDFSGNVIELTNARPIPLPTGSTLVPFGGLAALLNPTTFKLLSGSAGY